MAQNLLIVESPNKIKKLKSFLGPNWDVKASVGHISDLAIKQGIDGLGIKDLESFEPIYEISEDKKQVVKGLKYASSNKLVYIATDPDREGEAIANHIKNVLNLKSNNYKRVTFNEISEKAVKEAINNPRDIDYELVNAQETRRIIDRMYGFKGSSAIRRLSKDLKSVGRVQSAALKIVVNREQEIKNFKPISYKQPAIKINNTIFELKMPREEIIARNWDLVKWPKQVEVTDVIKVSKNVNPKKPLTTNDALKVASNLGFQPKYASKLLQNLFEVGFITYIRTDSNNVSEEFKNEAKKYIEKTFENINSDTSRIYKSKENSQEGHEAIRPVHINNDGVNINDEDQRLLYQTIWKIALASQMESGIDKVQEITIKVNDLIFTNVSRVITKEGYRSFYGYDKNKFSEVSFNKGLYDYQYKINDKTTTAPTRYSETSFLTKLENSGIGRPSTFASILQTIIDRNYVVSKKGQLIPSETGFKVIELLEKNFTKLIDINFTNDLEKKLDLIAKGKQSKLETLRDFNKTLNSCLGNMLDLIKQKWSKNKTWSSKKKSNYKNNVSLNERRTNDLMEKIRNKKES